VVAEVKHYQLLLLLLVRLLINYHTATVLSRVSEQLQFVSLYYPLSEKVLISRPPMSLCYLWHKNFIILILMLQKVYS
jgi:hypothetical protein